MNTKGQLSVPPEGSLESLLEIEKNTPRLTQRPAALPLHSLKLAPEVFQHRLAGSIPVASYDHVQEMARCLTTMGKPMEPILVVAIGKHFWVVDGHHRTYAYAAAKWTALVPVVHFEGSLLEARDRALSENIKGKLPVTLADKQEAAWRYICESVETVGQRKSKLEVRQLTTVSDGTIAHMRRLLAATPSLAEFTWAQAKRSDLPTREEADKEDWREIKAAKMSQQIQKNTGGKFSQYPDVLARALEMIDPELPALLVAEWPHAVAVVTEDHKQRLANLEALGI